MNNLFIDCSTGIAGDMLTSALLDLTTDDQKKIFSNKSNSLLPNVKTKYKKLKKFDTYGTTIDVIIDHDKEEFSEDVQSLSLSPLTIKIKNPDELNPFDLIKNFDLSANCKKKIHEIFNMLMETESYVHHSSANHAIHFNRIGSIDALIDISNVCILLEILEVNHIISTPINTGKGQVKYNNKIFSVPAPATKRLLVGVPNYNNDIYGELCTPTGISLIKYFTSNITYNFDKSCSLHKGIGFGQKEFNKPTMVRCIEF